jgi:hypothetical protein
LPGSGTASSGSSGNNIIAHAMRNEVRSATTVGAEACEASVQMQDESQDALGNQGLSVSA